MKFAFAAAALLSSSSLVSAISLFGSSGHKNVEVTAKFPESNAFSQVVNGQNNAIHIVLDNKEDVEIELKKVFGSFKDATTDKFIRNTTTATYQVPVAAGKKTTINHYFYSEFKPGDVRLNLWAEYTVGGQPYTAQAYDSVVQIVEPPASLFDPMLILTYVLVVALLGGVGYILYESFYPQQKKKKTRTVPTPSAPVDVKGTSSTTGYQEEWIPDHHIKTRTRKTKSNGALSSGDESGPEKVRGKK